MNLPFVNKRTKPDNGGKASRPPRDFGYVNILPADASEGDIVANVERKRAWFLDATRIMRRQWLINAAFARGQQFSVLHRTEDRLIDLQEPGRRKQITDDLIGPWVEHQIANMVTAMPTFEVIPSSLGSDSVQAARAGSALLAHYWDDWRFAVHYINHSSNLLNFGNSLVYLNYLEDGSRMVAEQAIDSETGLPAMDMNGSPLMSTRVIGNVTADLLVPQALICPLDPGDLDSKPWVAVQVRRELDYFRRQYANGDEVRPEEVDYRHEYDLSYINGEQVNRANRSGEVQYANEIIYFQKPQEGNPDGMVVAVAGGVLLKPAEAGRSAVSTWPYRKLTTYPIIHLHWRKEPGEFFARSPIERQIPIQKAINLVQSIIAENADEMAHLKWMVPNQAGVSSISDANDVLRYTYPFKPEQSPIQPMPTYVAEYIQSLKSAMRDVQSYHGASMGGAVSGVRSDLHAQNLQDQDLLPLTVVDELMQAAFEGLGEKVLLIAAEKLDTERLITYIGPNRRLATMKFKGAMLRDVSTVKVRLANKFMRSRVAAQNNIMQMFQMGMITDQYSRPDPIKATRLLEFALPDSAFADLQVHTDRAYNENDRLLQGEMPAVTAWQNHKIHLDVHQEEMNSPEFMALYERGMGDPVTGQPADPQAMQIAQAFQQHMDLHGQFLMQAMGMLQPAPEQSQGGQASGESGGNPNGKGQVTQQA